MLPKRVKTPPKQFLRCMDVFPFLLVLATRCSLVEINDVKFNKGWRPDILNTFTLYVHFVISCSRECHFIYLYWYSQGLLPHSLVRRNGFRTGVVGCKK